MFLKYPLGVRLFKITCFVVICLCTIPKNSCLKKKYFSLERPKITSFHPDYFSNVVFKSTKKSRTNPIHYVDVNVTILKPLNNNCKVYVSFYQLLSNVYKPSFVEYTMRICDILKKDVLIAAAFIESFNKIPKEDRPMPELTCPVVRGNYSFMNMVIPIKNIPSGFPFGEGRLFVNFTRNSVIIVMKEPSEWALKKPALLKFFGNTSF